MTQHPFATYDVFTDTGFAGNPLAIVQNADGLSTGQMQTMAREFNLSETIFVRTPADPAHAAEVRIFFPTAEIPFAGHPTIGCAIHLARKAMGPGDWETALTLEEQAGLVPVRIEQTNGIAVAEFTAPVIPHAPDTQPQNIPLDLLAPALGLPPGDLGLPGHVPAVWSGGPSFLYVPISTRHALRAATPCEPHWSALMAAAGVDSAYLYTPGETSDYTARMFSPTAGIPEDPATGSASAIFAAQLLAAGILAEGTTRLTLSQGVDMGRPSNIGFAADVQNGALTAVRISGSAVPISQGHITAP